MDTETLPPEAEEYLRQLRLGLVALPREEREDILAELRSHLRDRQARGQTPLLAGFEEAQTYAWRFLSETALRGALARGTSMGSAELFSSERSPGFRCCSPSCR